MLSPSTVLGDLTNFSAVPQKSHALVLLILKRGLLIFSAMLETINSRSLLFLSQYFDLLNGLRNYDVLLFSETHIFVPRPLFAVACQSSWRVRLARHT